MRSKKAKGVGFVELVLVILIVGVLTAISIPKYIDLRQDAGRASCRGNVSAIQTALTAYCAKHAIIVGAEFPSSSGGTTRADFAVNYFANGTIPVCPITNQAYTWNSSTGVIAQHQH